MKTPFTLADYIKANNLGVSTSDPKATKLINAHLNQLGYVRTRKSGVWVYVSAQEVVDYKVLADKLGALRKAAVVRVVG